MSKFLDSAKRLVNNLNESIKVVPTELPFDYTKPDDHSKLLKFLKLGNLLGVKGNNYPALLQLDKIKGVAFKINDSNREEINLAIQHFILQIAKCSDKGYISTTVIDAKGMGKNFRNLRRLNKSILSNFIADDEGVKSTIDEIYNKSVSIITECLTNHKSLSDYNVKTGHVQPYRILAISDFPYGFINLDKFETMLQNADESGLFVFLTYDETIVNKPISEKFNQVLSHLFCLEEFGEAVNDFYREIIPERFEFLPKPYILQLDRKDISFDNINRQLESLLENDLIENDQIDGVRIPIGKTGGQTHYFTLGYESDNFHAIIGGQSGKGKTVLLNNIVARGIETYSSDELRFFIIDCSGTGFYEFDDAPGIQLICRSSSVEICEKAVQQIEQELKLRENLFQENGVSDLKSYVKKTKKPLPKLICLIDEFHILYTGKEKYISYFDSILVDRVIRIGRKFGIHLIVCTQSLGGGVRRSILDNIPLRIALGMTTDQSNGFLGLRNDAAANLDKGIAIYNSQNGNFNANKSVKINYISFDDIERIISISKKQDTQSLNYTKTII